MNYPEDLKQKIIKRMLHPNNELISKIAREEGIAEQTLRNWQKGLFVEQIKAWKDACLQANGGVAKEAAKLNKKLKESEKEKKTGKRAAS